MPSLPDLSFLSPHTGVEILRTEQASIVSLEDQNGILGQVLILQKFHQFAHIPIDIANHSEIKCEAFLETIIQVIELGLGEHIGNHLSVLFFRNEGTMGSIGGKIAHKWFILFRRFHHEPLGLIKKDIRAITLELFFLPVVHVDIVKIIVSPIGRNRRDGGGWIPNTFLKPSILRAVRIVGPEVPFTKNSGQITRVAKIIRHNRDFFSYQCPTATHIDRSITGGIQPGEQLSTGRSTHRSNMIIRQTQALHMQPIEVRGLQDWIAMGRDLWITLIVSHDDQDIRPTGK